MEHWYSSTHWCVKVNVQYVSLSLETEKASIAQFAAMVMAAHYSSLHAGVLTLTPGMLYAVVDA